MEAPRRGLIHSAFQAAANIVFPDGLVLSLNAASTPRLPNGLQLSTPPGGFPFALLRTGMPVIFGAQRLHIESISCSLDLSQCPQWNPHVERAETLNMDILGKNRGLVEKYIGECFSVGARVDDVDVGRALVVARRGSHVCRRGEEHDGPHSPPDCVQQGPSPPIPHLPRPYEYDGNSLCLRYIYDLARYLCGRGTGLTPSGDDILAGWMAAGWLLYGPDPEFLALCQHIIEVARQQTHVLSQCWLMHAARGNVAEPILALLSALTADDTAQLELTTNAVLSMGASSGYCLAQGILLALQDGI